MITMHLRTVLLYFMFIRFWNLDCRQRNCIWYGKPVCCRNLRYNEALDTCEDCPIGYHHWNCSRKCQPPFYGKDCQQECDCDNEDCHFSNGCQSIKVPTFEITHVENGTTVHTTTLATNTVTQLPNEQTMPAKQPDDSLSHNTNFIIILGSVGLGLFLLLFGMLVGVYIYKSLQRNVGRMSVNEGVSKDEHNYTPIRQQPETLQRAPQAGNVPENSGYITPVNERLGQDEEVVLYDLPDESGDRKECQVEPYYSDTINNVTDTYLTPESVSQHLYVEVI